MFRGLVKTQDEMFCDAKKFDQNPLKEAPSWGYQKYGPPSRYLAKVSCK